MRSGFVAVVAVAAMFALTGCTAQYNYARASTKTRGRLAVVSLSDGTKYLIDPRSETCFLVYFGAPVLIPCDPLKRNVPEAAEHIRWLADAPPGGREAPARPLQPPAQPAAQPPTSP
jgi:hypothetical protein